MTTEGDKKAQFFNDIQDILDGKVVNYDIGNCFDKWEEIKWIEYKMFYNSKMIHNIVANDCKDSMRKVLHKIKDIEQYVKCSKEFKPTTMRSMSPCYNDSLGGLGYILTFEMKAVINE